MWRQYESEGSLKFWDSRFRGCGFGILASYDEVSAFLVFFATRNDRKSTTFFTVTTSFHGSVACVCQEPDQDLLETL